MEQATFNEFFKSKYQRSLDNARRRALYHQQLHKRLEWSLIILSFAIMILITLSSSIDCLVLRIISGLCSATVLSIATTMKSLKTQEKWSFYYKLGNDLENEYYLYKFNGVSYQKFSDKEGLFVRRILSILDEADQKMPQRTIPPADVSGQA